MNPRILVAVAVGAFVAVLAVVAFSGQAIINDVSQGGILKSPEQEPAVILPVEVALEGITVRDVDGRSATIDVRLALTNPNFKSVILQFVKYELYEGDMRIHAGEIGSRPGGFLTESNYFTLISGQPTVLSDTIILKNTGNTPELWEALTAGTPSWRIQGEAYFNLSSMTSGGENIAHFEFVP